MSHGPTCFILPVPLAVEPLLEVLLSERAMALPLGQRAKAAGEYVAELIREAHATRKPARRSAVPPPPPDDA